MTTAQDGICTEHYISQRTILCILTCNCRMNDHLPFLVLLMWDGFVKSAKYIRRIVHGIVL